MIAYTNQTGSTVLRLNPMVGVDKIVCTKTPLPDGWVLFVCDEDKAANKRDAWRDAQPFPGFARLPQWPNDVSDCSSQFLCWEYGTFKAKQVNGSESMRRLFARNAIRS